MRNLILAGMLLLSCNTSAQQNIQQTIDCSSYEQYAQHNKALNKSYDKAFLQSLRYQYWFVPKPPGFENSGVEPMMNTPHVALKTAKGWLSGISRGEFGGAVVHHKADGSIEIVAKANVEDIYTTPFGIVVTEGLAHMGGNRGSIILITSTATGFEAKTIHRLPGKPLTSWKLPNGDLLINTYKNGSVVLSKEGEIKQVQCNKVRS